MAGTDGLSDEALLSALAVGDPDVGAVYVRRFERRIYGLALSMVADATVAEGIPLGTAKTRIRAATGKLLSALVGSEIRP